MVYFHRLRMREVPVRMLERGGGVSSIRSGTSAYYMFKVLLAIFLGLVCARPVVEVGDEALVAAPRGIWPWSGGSRSSRSPPGAGAAARAVGGAQGRSEEAGTDVRPDELERAGRG